MKLKKTFKIVMSRTEKGSELLLNYGVLYLDSRNLDLDGEVLFVHLYVLSGDTIKENDYIYDEQSKGVFKKCKNDILRKGHFKIIASTDKSITPNYWIHEGFVSEYVKRYNNGVRIEKVELEILKDYTPDSLAEYPFSYTPQDEIDTNPDGSVVIFVKEQVSLVDAEKAISRAKKMLSNDKQEREEAINERRSEIYEIIRNLKKDNSVSASVIEGNIKIFAKELRSLYELENQIPPQSEPNIYSKKQVEDYINSAMKHGYYKGKDMVDIGLMPDIATKFIEENL